jgi:hexosaminidase
MKRLTKHFVICFTAVLLFASCDNTPKTPKTYNEGINITPVPLELTHKEGSFALKNNTAFISNDESTDKIAAYFAAKLKKSTGYSLPVEKQERKSDFISLSLVADLPVNNEGYTLDVTPEGVTIQAKTAQGIFYGMQTVMQLLPAEIESPALVKTVDWNIPAVNIKDEPRFGYRGMHLDVCRHFVDVDFVKKQLDVMAMFKLNKFHWHLTEDQGWRIEIKKYPKLTEIGAKRTEGDGTEYGPYFYTQDQIKEVVAYAKERFIEVIPEVELPGHAVAALAAYPELGCTDQHIPVRNIWGVANDVYCAGNEQVFTFLEDVIAEVIPLFESDYFHIGGDECPKIRWEKCPKCQARIKELGLKATKEHTAEERLQSYFVQRIEKFLLKHNKKMIGWDEILEGGLAPTATVMSWRGEEGGIASANMGHDVIMTPGQWLYLDKYQGDEKLLPVTIGGYLTLKKVYGYDPVPQQIADDKKHHILGAQANIWAEYKYTPEDYEHDIYPRVIALAEIDWSDISRKDYNDFERRINNQRVRLDMHNINYYIPLPEQKGPHMVALWTGDSVMAPPSCDYVAFVDETTLAFKTTEPVKMVYTTDGSDPTLKSAEYTEPLTFNESTVLKIRSVLPQEKMSRIRTIEIVKQDYAPATEKPADYKKGLKAEYYKGYALHVADLDGKTPDKTEWINQPTDESTRVPDYREVYEDDFCSTILTGYINIPEDGVYYFSTPCEMWLDGNLFITNASEMTTARRFPRSDRSVALAKGLHPVKIVRLSGIFGGWPTQWENVFVQIRKDNEPSFKTMDTSYFVF